jgi:urease accessory protein
VITSLFGLFHGYAHGLEMLGINEVQGYALGFVVTTAALHLAGIVTVIATRTRFVKLPQMLGGIITVSGVWLLSVT